MQAREAGGKARTEAWRAGDIELDVGQQRVLRAGVPIGLPRLSFEMLLALMRAAPNFLSNEELMSQVWPGMVVSPETVTQRVKLLRDALGDDPKRPACIEGLRGRGYRMIPAVTPMEPLAPTARVPEAARRTARGVARWAAGAAALGAIMVVLVVLKLLPAPAPADAGPAPDARTAAILPFPAVDDSDHGRNLARVLIDSVQAQLSAVRGLTVIAGYSASRVDDDLSPQEIGRHLGARYLVRGSVQESGGRLRVTAKLVDARNGRSLWTQQFERDTGDPFGMQDDVAASVVHALEAHIAGLDPTLPAQVRSSNVEAQFAYWNGRKLLGRTTVAGSVEAEREFMRARQLDPEFVPAIIGLYDARMQAASLRRADIPAALAANAPLLEEAQKLQPDSGASQLARAMWDRQVDLEERVRLYEEGLRKDPGNARAMTAFSELLDEMERPDEAARWLARALDIDPLWPRARFRQAQRNFSGAGSAIERQTQNLLGLDPDYYPAQQRQAKYLWQMHGEMASALALAERAIASDPENPWAPHTAVAIYLDVNDSEAAENLAAGNPVVATSTAALRAQYAGDWRKAGEAALAAGSRAFGQAERWGVPAALRDLALKTDRKAEIIQVLSRQYELPLDAPEWNLSPFNFREAQMLAHVLLASGSERQARARLAEVIRWIDANPHMGPVYNLRTKAQALALLGRPDEALDQLAESFRQNDHTHWWYTLQSDPTWDGLRDHPRFLEISREVRAHAASERRKLEQMRRDGRVPLRTSTGRDPPR